MFVCLSQVRLCFSLLILVYEKLLSSGVWDWDILPQFGTSGCNCVVSVFCYQKVVANRSSL